MESPASAFPAPDAAGDRFARFGLFVAVFTLSVYALLLAWNVGVYASGSDSSGYMNHARMLAHGTVHVRQRTITELPRRERSEFLYAPLGLKPADDGETLVPTYPAGLPLCIALASKMVGLGRAAHLVIWAMAMAGGVMIYVLGRVWGLTPALAYVAALAVATSPVYLLTGVQALSDVPALVWATAAITAAWQSRRHANWAYLGGAAFGMAVLTRPTNALLIVPLAICLGFSWRRWAAFGIGGVPFGTFFCLHSHSAYGSYFTTGYGDSAGLDSKWIGVTVLHYLRWIPIAFTPLAAVFLLVPVLFRKNLVLSAVLLAWVLIFAGFYAEYNCTHETWWYLRFLLPAAPAMILGAMLVLQDLAARLSFAKSVSTVAAILGVVVAGSNVYWGSKLRALDLVKGERTYAMTADWANQHLPRNSVIATMQFSGALFYYTDFTLIRYDMLDASGFRKVATAVQSAHRPLYAITAPFEISGEGAFTTHMPDGRWTQIGAVRDVTIWQWSAASRKENEPTVKVQRPE